MGFKKAGRVAFAMAILAGTVVGCGGAKSGAVGADGRVAIAVTDEGFVPAVVEVPAGKPVTLVVTRKTKRTCATELVMKSMGIDQKLPLGQAVEITFTPERPGTLDYACAMDMIKGQVVVR
jgi:plastocyanin domain-containing protein